DFRHAGVVKELLQDGQLLGGAAVGRLQLVRGGQEGEMAPLPDAVLGAVIVGQREIAQVADAPGDDEVVPFDGFVSGSLDSESSGDGASEAGLFGDQEAHAGGMKRWEKRTESEGVILVYPD